MKILAIDFSTSIRSVALVETSPGQARTLLGQSKESGTRETNAFQMIRAVLTQAGIQPSNVEALAIGLGPGSYGGIRVSVSIAQGWQVATGIRTAGIETVQILAETARQLGHRGTLNVVIDAQRNEFYVAAFRLDESDAKQTGALAIVTRADLERLNECDAMLIGPDLDGRVDGVTAVYPDAAVLAELAFAQNEFVTADQLTPVYIRPVAFVKAPAPRTDL
jgi:tRNA threonylcarbamoyladenosine biosynthesis protein TsaB